MPAYTLPNIATALGPGQVQTLVSGATESAVKTTIAVGLGQNGGLTPQVTLINTTSQTATVAVSADDSSSGSYIALKNADTNQAITVATNSAVVFTCPAPFMLCTFGTAPTSGTLVICR